MRCNYGSPESTEIGGVPISVRKLATISHHQPPLSLFLRSNVLVATFLCLRETGDYESNKMVFVLHIASKPCLLEGTQFLYTVDRLKLYEIILLSYDLTILPISVQSSYCYLWFSFSENSLMVRALEGRLADLY